MTHKKQHSEYFLLQINGMLVVTGAYVRIYNLLLPRDFPVSSSWQLELRSVVTYHSLILLCPTHCSYPLTVNWILSNFGIFLKFSSIGDFYVAEDSMQYFAINLFF